MSERDIQHVWYGEPIWLPRFLSGWWQRREHRHWQKWQQVHRWDTLARYNGERARGIVHTPEWQKLMAEQQRAFNQEEWGDQDIDHGFPVMVDPSE